jgi:hypothetical protein
MQPINPFEWIEHHYVLEYVITITLSIFLISMTLLTLKAVQGALFTKPRRSHLCVSSEEVQKSPGVSEAKSDLHDLIQQTVEEALRIKEFDSAMVLMEKQRLKKLEIEELKLQLELQTKQLPNHERE